MQSLGSASCWPSRDSPSSSHSFLHSEGDQTEDEADVFLSEGEGDGGGSRVRSAPAVFGGLAVPRLKRDLGGRYPCSARLILVSSSGDVRTAGEGRTEGDFAFAQKCAELQGFVRPLLELLNGLKRGKYDQGLSSFQQSVAMDRIQRIVGVLQNPSMGEKHLHTLLQVEMMLKLWFPRVSPSALPASSPAAAPAQAANLARGGGTAPRWRRDQLLIPVKKRRLSLMYTESPASSAPACKRIQRDGPADRTTSPPSPETASARPADRGTRCEKEEGKEISRLASVPRPSEETEEGGAGNVAPSPVAAGSPAMQDTSISSTTPLSPALDSAPPTHDPARCRRRSRPSGTSQRGNRSLPLLTMPVNALER